MVHRAQTAATMASVVPAMKPVLLIALGRVNRICAHHSQSQSQPCHGFINHVTVEPMLQTAWGPNADETICFKS